MQPALVLLIFSRLAATSLPEEPAIALRATSTRTDARLASPPLAVEPGTGSSVHAATIWSGVGLMIAGATIATVSWLAPDRVAYYSICRHGPCAQQFEPEFKTACDVTSSNAGCAKKGGLLVLPLGYSLIGAGATWALGSSLVGEDDVPWMPLVLGVAVGVASYALSAALNGSNPGAPRVSARARSPLAAIVFTAFFPARALSEVDPGLAVYVVDRLEQPDPGTASPQGVLTAHAIAPPFEVIATSPQGPINGALALDPIRRVLYGGRCCNGDTPIEAFDAVTLQPLADKRIALRGSGSIALKVDPLRRVLYAYDTVKTTLQAISIGAATHGAQLASIDLPLPAESDARSAGDMIAIDVQRGVLFATGGDGGPVLAIAIAGLSEAGGAFGSVADTQLRARSTGRSSGAVTIDERGGRVFTVPVTGRVRVSAAEPPYGTIREIAIPDMGIGACGMYYDGRTDTLFVGRGTTSGTPSAAARDPVAVDLGAAPPGPAAAFASAPQAPGVRGIAAVSFAGPPGLFALPRARDGGSEDLGPIFAHVAREGCACTATQCERALRRAWWDIAALLFLLAALMMRRRKAGRSSLQSDLSFDTSKQTLTRSPL